MLDKIVLLIILGLSAVGTVLSFCDSMGFLPDFIKSRINKNKASDTINVLKNLGIDLDKTKRLNAKLIYKYPETLRIEDLQNLVRSDLNRYLIKNSTVVGQLSRITLPYYYDLVGATNHPETAKAYAKYLSNYMYLINDDITRIKNYHYDFIVTPKKGSVALGYEFANLLNIQFVLHEPFERFTGNNEEFKKHFSCYKVPPKGSTALIVDDSTTGGSMILDAARVLRELGYMVTDCLVVFEPTLRDVRKTLQINEINLLSVITTHNSSDPNWKTFNKDPLTRSNVKDKKSKNNEGVIKGGLEM